MSSRPPLRYRQVHLDFHTSPHIPAIGEKFDARRWCDTLQAAAVDSVTLFAKCHHGWSYHPTRVGKTHPHLGFDLLRADTPVFGACCSIGDQLHPSAELDPAAA